MDDTIAAVQALLQEAAETHHQVFAITEGTDLDWATWYADWLVNLSRLQALLGRPLVRSELTYLLVALDREYSAKAPDVHWSEYYAERLVGAWQPS